MQCGNGIHRYGSSRYGSRTSFDFTVNELFCQPLTEFLNIPWNKELHSSMGQQKVKPSQEDNREFSIEGYEIHRSCCLESTRVWSIVSKVKEYFGSAAY